MPKLAGHITIEEPLETAMLSQNTTTSHSFTSRLTLSFFLILVTSFVFLQVQNHEFLNYDDPLFVTENSHVRQGLTLEGIVWAFANMEAKNWHPLTWLTHMLDCDVYGLNAGGHHVTNLLLHLANTTMLFLVFLHMTRAFWRSAFLAALFAIHPLHVESVAWIAERRDVLSGFFWILTVGVYAHYTRRPSILTYLSVLLLFCFGLMAKPMVVSLPLVLLLLDYWPLGRFRASPVNHDLVLAEGAAVAALRQEKASALRLIAEKIPLFAMSALASIVAIVAQNRAGAVMGLYMLPVETRIANALVSYVEYIERMIWPVGLAVFYPHPGIQLNMWQAAGAALCLVCISALALRAARTKPYIAVGWLWYSVTLLPVIGLVQVGSQSMADRYTYLPLIGLFIIGVWGVGDLATTRFSRRIVLTFFGAILVIVFTICSWFQVNYWRSNISLFEHALNVTEDNWLAHNNLGMALAEQGRFSQALAHFCAAQELGPMDPTFRNNMAIALAALGRLDEAVACWSDDSHAKSDLLRIYNDLGAGLAKLARYEAAITCYAEALQISGDCPVSHRNMAVALAELGRVNEALVHYAEALRADPNDAMTHNNVGVVLAKEGRRREAIFHLSEAIRLDPEYVIAHRNLDLASRGERLPSSGQ